MRVVGSGSGRGGLGIGVGFGVVGDVDDNRKRFFVLTIDASLPSFLQGSESLNHKIVLMQ